ncbi:MAG: DUF308 domain-containing protein [Peptococcaceae bacterium]|nr:DUF308 domain-containing protein [Peptococcaceae bacterium]
MKLLGIVTGILLIVSGCYCFANPVVTFANLGWVVGAIVLASGVGSFGSWWNGRKTNSSNIWDMLSALLTIVIGLLILFNLSARLFTDMTLIAFFGAWIILSGILRIVASVKIKFSWWGFGLLWGIILLVIGIYALFHPIISLISLGWCIAFVFISQGINLTFAALSMNGKNSSEK